jgi:D-3-phosphoglycerate dehydrogenase
MKASSKKPVALYYSMLNFQPATIRLLEGHFRVATIASPRDDSPSLLSTVEVLFAPLGYQTNQEKIDKCPRLKVIASNTTGHPHIDVDYARSLGIQVVTLKDEQKFLATVTPTAELTWGLIIALTRNIIPAFGSVRCGNWNRRNFGGTKMLSRMHLGVIGYGRLGKMVARYGRAARMSVGFFDPFVEEHDGVIRYQTLEELVRVSDVITLHVPHEKETENLIDEKIFSEFRSGSYFINTARGELVDHQALLAALVNGKLNGAALDVIDHEFDPDFQVKDNPLWEYAVTNNNLILTPHIGGSTRDAWAATEQHTIKKILDVLGE